LRTTVVSVVRLTEAGRGKGPLTVTAPAGVIELGANPGSHVGASKAAAQFSYKERAFDHKRRDNLVLLDNRCQVFVTCAPTL